MERSPQKRGPRKITERRRRRQPQHPPHPNTITTTHQNNDQARSTLYALAAPTCPAEASTQRRRKSDEGGLRSTLSSARPAAAPARRPNGLAPLPKVKNSTPE